MGTTFVGMIKATIYTLIAYVLGYVFIFNVYDIVMGIVANSESIGFFNILKWLMAFALLFIVPIIFFKGTGTETVDNILAKTG